MRNGLQLLAGHWFAFYATRLFTFFILFRDTFSRKTPEEKYLEKGVTKSEGWKIHTSPAGWTLNILQEVDY